MKLQRSPGRLGAHHPVSQSTRHDRGSRPVRARGWRHVPDVTSGTARSPRHRREGLPARRPPGEGNGPGCSALFRVAVPNGGSVPAPFRAARRNGPCARQLFRTAGTLFRLAGAEQHGTAGASASFRTVLPFRKRKRPGQAGTGPVALPDRFRRGYQIGDTSSAAVNPP